MGMWHQERSRQQLHTASMCRSPMPLLLPVSPSVTNRNTTQYLQGNWMLMQYWGLVWFLHSYSFDFSILELHSAKYFPNWWNLLPGTLATAFYLQLRKKLTTFALFFFSFSSCTVFNTKPGNTKSKNICVGSNCDERSQSLSNDIHPHPRYSMEKCSYPQGHLGSLSNRKVGVERKRDASRGAPPYQVCFRIPFLTRYNLHVATGSWNFWLRAKASYIMSLGVNTSHASAVPLQVVQLWLLCGSSVASSRFT